ncbi:MAG: restriction endonuclease subunit S [Ideonella sp.]|nr:restriction endonuclease subunit S [Ideonella sp.]
MSMETGVHYPLHLDALPKGWRAGYVGDFAKEIEPGFASGEHNQTGEGVAHLRPMNVDRDGKIDLSVTKFVSGSKDDRRLAVGDVLFNNTNSPDLVGKTAAVSVAGDFAFSNHMTRIRFADDVLPKFGVQQRSTADARLLLDQHPQLRSSRLPLEQASVSSRTLARGVPFVWGPPATQERIVAEIERQFSRLDEAVANLKRVKANAMHFGRATVEVLTSPGSFSTNVMGTVTDVAVSLDNMREPVNKTERAKRVGTIPYLGANGQTGWIDEARFDEELVLVVEDETFVGRKQPFSYYFSGKCWVNNHTHVLRARRDLVLPKYLNLALSYYPFIPLTTGSTGRRKLTKATLMSAPIRVPDLMTQQNIVAEVDRRLSIVREVEAEVDANLARAQALRQAVLARAFAA